MRQRQVWRSIVVTAFLVAGTVCVMAHPALARSLASDANKEDGQQPPKQPVRGIIGILQGISKDTAQPDAGKEKDKEGHPAAPGITADTDDAGEADDEDTPMDEQVGVTTVTATAPDGSTIQETRDNKTGETLSEVGISADGRPFLYKTGSDADKAFEGAQSILTAKYSSDQDFVTGGERGASGVRRNAELDRQLEKQLAGGSAVTGGNIIVSSTYKSKATSSRQEGQGGELETSTERLTLSVEVGAVNPDGPYGVKAVGEPVPAEGEGSILAEALSSALGSAASTVITKITSETLDRMSHTQNTTGGGRGGKTDQQSTSENLEASSFVVFDSYKVDSVVRTADGRYVVKVRATPGITVRK